jgi:hypothetical protein
VLRGLRPQDRDRVVEGWLARGGPCLPRVFAFIDLATPRLRTRALDALATAPELDSGRAWLEITCNRLGVAFHDEVRQLLRRHPQAEERVAEALGRERLDAIVSGPKSDSAEALRKAAAKLGDEGPRGTIHVLDHWDGVRADASVTSRVGPTAIGVPAGRWPRDLDGDPMRHVLTLSLRDVPELAARHPGKAALAVFLAQDGGHAYEPDNEDAAVVWLDEADLALGELDLVRTSDGDGEHDDDEDDDDLDPYIDADTRPLLVVPVEVPLRALEGPQALEGASRALRKLHELLEEVPGRVGGGPGWLVDETHDTAFVLQIHDALESLPVEGSARLYVFEDVALWQSRPFS